MNKKRHIGKEIVEEKDGWYFYDETWSDKYGPYKSFRKCHKKFSKYCFDNLLSEKEQINILTKKIVKIFVIFIFLFLLVTSHGFYLRKQFYIQLQNVHEQIQETGIMLKEINK